MSPSSSPCSNISKSLFLMYDSWWCSKCDMLPFSSFSLSIQTILGRKNRKLINHGLQYKYLLKYLIFCRPLRSTVPHIVHNHNRGRFNALHTQRTKTDKAEAGTWRTHATFNRCAWCGLVGEREQQQQQHSFNVLFVYICLIFLARATFCSKMRFKSLIQ